MTTIAYANGIMACDSAWADEDGMVMTRRTKIVRLPSGALLGEAGDDDSRAAQALFAHAKTPRSLPTRKQLSELALDYEAVLVLPKGKVYNVAISHDKSKGWTGSLFEVAEGYHAVGGGAAHALTAMDCNRSAKESVNLAIKRNIHCRPPIHLLPLKKPPRSAAKPKPKRKSRRSGIDVDMRSWDALVKAVADYEGTSDPDAAKRNRDDHGPDIPTQNLDWRDKL